MDPQPRNLAQLATALESAWLNIPENTFRDLSDSLPARLAAVRSVKVVQQPMRASAKCAHPTTRDHWAMRCISRCPDQVVSLKPDPQCLSSSNLGTHLSTHCSKDESTLLYPGIEPGPVVRKCGTLPLDQWTFKMLDTADKIAQ
ncbi:transposable element Tcb1 transposase [Trichonephila clavipes]|nr:transposable element Tcb1 transposase [Trichonephila clavipes]